MKTALTNYSWQSIAFFAVGVLLLLVALTQGVRSPFASVEMRFTDSSAHGLAIMPASCASYGSGNYHYNATNIGDGGYQIPPDGNEYGAYDAWAGWFFCIQNYSGAYVYVPGRSAGELQTMKNYVGTGGAVKFY